MTGISNLVQQKTTATGAGSLALMTVPGWRSFAAAFGTGGTDAFFYVITHAQGGEWEVGTGHMSDSATLVRDTVLESSAAGAKVAFSAGVKHVVNDVPASLMAAAVVRLPAPGLARTRPRVAFLGTSTAEYSWVYASPSLYSSSRSPLSWWHALSGGALDMDVFIGGPDPYARGFSGANFGVAGETSTQVRARVPHVIAAAPDICVLLAGANNVTQPDTVVADVTASVDALRAAGILPVYFAVTPRDSASWTLTNLKQASQINRRVRDYLAASGKGIFVDVNRYLCDADSAEGRSFAGTLHSDAIHLTTWSAFQAGRALHEAVTPLLALPPPEISSNAEVYDATHNPFGNLWVNPLVSTAGAVGTVAGAAGTGTTAATGSGATSLGRNFTVERASGTCALSASMEARRPGEGNWQVMSLTQASPTSGASLFYLRTNGTDVTSGLATGTWVRFSCTVDVSTFGDDAVFSGIQNLALTLDFRNSGGSLGQAQALKQFSAVSLPNAAWQGVLETPPFKIPSGCDRLRPQLEILCDDARGGTGTVKAGSFSLRACPDPSANW